MISMYIYYYLFRTVLARIRRLRKSPGYLLVILQGRTNPGIQSRNPIQESNDSLRKASARNAQRKYQKVKISKS